MGDSANSAPVAADDTYAVTLGAVLAVGAANGLLANDGDADGDTLTVTLVSSPASGAVTLNGDGSFTYMHYPDFSGVDYFTYSASDGALNSDEATVTIRLAPN